MRIYSAYVLIGPLHGKKGEVKKQLISKLDFEKVQIVEMFQSLAGSPTKTGSRFERQFCRSLSLWWSNGKDPDIFWRTSGSGSRATKKGLDIQIGDVASLKEEGFSLTRKIAFELKQRYRLPLLSFWCKGGTQISRWLGDLQKKVSKFKMLGWVVLKVRNESPVVFVCSRSDFEKLSLPSTLVCFSNEDFFGFSAKQFFQDVSPESFLMRLKLI